MPPSRTTAPVSARAADQVASVVRPDDRVLLTGAGGWFGSTVAALLHGHDAQVMHVTQRPRTVQHGNGSVEAVAWDWATVRDFAPTVVVDCAFVLRDYIDQTSIEQYVHVNTVLTQRLLQVSQLPGVRTVLSVSSGAAAHPVDASRHEVDVDPYGYLKRQAELALSGLDAAVDANLVVARPYSLSGTLVSRPRRYAFSDLVLQAREGAVHVKAGHDVWRRYVGVDDFFAVCLGVGAQRSGTVSSAGELVEFGALAERVNHVLDARATVTRADRTGAPADDYYSRDTTWDEACRSLSYRPADLDEQIRTVDAYLAAAGRS